MPGSKRKIPLTEIISSYLNQTKQSDGERLRIQQMAFSGFEELMLDVHADIKTVRIPVKDNKTAVIPQDNLTWVKIGVLNAHGEIATLKINNDLSTYKSLMPERLTRISPDIGVNILTTPNYLNCLCNDGYEVMYGVAGGLLTAGECRVDEDNYVIILDPNFTYDHIMYEYMFSPEQDDDYTVPFQCRQALIDWIYYCDNKGRRSQGPNAAEGYYQMFLRSKKLARKRMKPFRLQEVEQALRDTARLSIKV